LYKTIIAFRLYTPCLLHNISSISDWSIQLNTSCMLSFNTFNSGFMTSTAFFTCSMAILDWRLTCLYLPYDCKVSFMRLSFYSYLSVQLFILIFSNYKEYGKIVTVSTCLNFKWSYNVFLILAYWDSAFCLTSYWF